MWQLHAGFFSFKIKAAVSVAVIHILLTPSLLATPQHLHGTFQFFFLVLLSLPLSFASVGTRRGGSCS